MEQSNALTQLFSLWAEQENPPIIELLNIDHHPVGAIYLNKFKNSSHLVISETNNQERFYLYYEGIGIYFSFYRKLFN